MVCGLQPGPGDRRYSVGIPSLVLLGGAGKSKTEKSGVFFLCKHKSVLS